MLINIILFLIGISFLYFGAELLVKGSSFLALRLGIQPMIIGLTIIAMGTSAPELSVSLLSAIKGTKDIALGNIIGSNIANIGLVIGIAALIRPLEIKQSTIRKEMPFLIMCTIIFYGLSLGKTLHYLAGILLLTAFVFYIAFLIHTARKDKQMQKEITRDLAFEPEKQKSPILNVFFVITGLAGLIGGSTLMVNSARIIALGFGISEVVIGITLVAVGTSLPELAISSVGAFRGQIDIAVGNAVGSNLFNLLFVVGLVSLIIPIPVNPSMLKVDYPIMIIFTVIFLPMMITGKKISRIEGLLLLAGYVAYIGYTFS